MNVFCTYEDFLLDSLDGHSLVPQRLQDGGAMTQQIVDTATGALKNKRLTFIDELSLTSTRVGHTWSRSWTCGIAPYIYSNKNKNEQLIKIFR